MPASNLFKEIEKQYFLIDLNFNRLHAALGTDAERNELRQTYVTARDNYYAARGKMLSDNDPVLGGLGNQLKALDKQIANDIQSLNNAAAVLRTLSQAVGIAVKIVALVAV